MTLNEFIESWKFLMYTWLPSLFSFSLTQIFEGVSAVLIADYPVTHNLLVVTQRERVSVVGCSALTDEKIALCNLALIL